MFLILAMKKILESEIDKIMRKHVSFNKLPVEILKLITTLEMLNSGQLRALMKDNDRDHKKW